MQGLFLFILWQETDNQYFFYCRNISSSYFSLENQGVRVHCLLGLMGVRVTLDPRTIDEPEILDIIFNIAFLADTLVCTNI